MKVTDKTTQDFTTAGLIQFAVAIGLMDASQLILETLQRHLDWEGAQSSAVHNQKKAINKIRANMKIIIQQLDIALDPIRQKAALSQTKCWDKVSLSRYDSFRAHANDIAQLILLYYDRAELNDANRDRVKKYIRKLTGINAIDDEVIDLYRMK